MHPIYTGQTSSPLTSNVQSGGETGIGSSVDVNRNHAIYPTQTTTYYTADHLGSSRLITSGNGYPVWSGVFMPYGQEWNPQITMNKYKFTGDERDSESNLDHTWFRQYEGTQGRWLSPDPAGITAADLTNPQSLNLYAYVNNNSMNAVDPTGQCGEIVAGIGQSPFTDSGAALMDIAQATQSSIVFPYSGQSKFAAALSIALQMHGTATEVARQGLESTAIDSMDAGQPFVSVMFSGGAQANLSAEGKAGITPGTSVFIDPGLGIAGGPVTSSADSPVYRGVGLTSDLVNFTSPAQNNLSEPNCGHDAECVIAYNQQIATKLGEAGPCANPTVFTRQGSFPLGSGGAGIGAGGTWAIVDTVGYFDWSEGAWASGTPGPIFVPGPQPPQPLRPN